MSPTFVENLVLHPKVLEITDGMLLPRETMAPNSSRASREPEGTRESFAYEMLENAEGGKQLMARDIDPEKGPNCHHYNVGASVMLEVHKGGENQFGDPFSNPCKVLLTPKLMKMRSLSPLYIIIKFTEHWFSLFPDLVDNIIILKKQCQTIPVS